jgi:hypothetical protein
VRVVVERPAVVGHLQAAVSPADGSDQRLLDAAHRLDLALGEVHGPCGGAAAVAGAFAASLVPSEAVENAVLPVEQDRPVPRGADLERLRQLCLAGRPGDGDDGGDGEQDEDLLHVVPPERNEILRA